MRKWNDDVCHSQSHNCATIFGIIAALLLVLQLSACALTPDAPDQNATIEATWGVRVESVRLTAAGHLVDFRYRVIDPEKALTLMKRGGEAFLQDEKTGTKLPVPVTKVGQLRGTGTKPKDDRVYTVMFNSGNGIIQPGSRVTVVIGDFKAEHLIVE